MSQHWAAVERVQFELGRIQLEFVGLSTFTLARRNFARSRFAAAAGGDKLTAL
jgi:hypothetical protein